MKAGNDLYHGLQVASTAFMFPTSPLALLDSPPSWDLRLRLVDKGN
jgi:hypothetical protein